MKPDFLRNFPAKRERVKLLMKKVLSSKSTFSVIYQNIIHRLGESFHFHLYYNFFFYLSSLICNLMYLLNLAAIEIPSKENFSNGTHFLNSRVWKGEHFQVQKKT